MRLVTFASGSGGNCSLVSGGDTHILIDAGISMRRIKTALASLGLHPDELSGVLITHEHRDHVAALATMLRQTGLRLYAPRTVANHLIWTVAGIEPRISIIAAGADFGIDGLIVRAFHTSHDTDESVGYRIAGDGAVLGYCTDTGCVTADMLNALTGVDAAVIEANHDEEMLRYGSYPYILKRRILSERGHLSNAACGELAVRLCAAGAVKLVLAHLSRENNRPDVALDTVARCLAARGMHPELYVAPESGLLEIQVEGGAGVCCQSG